jgi:hypothetical protein
LGGSISVLGGAAVDGIGDELKRIALVKDVRFHGSARLGIRSPARNDGIAL